MPTVEQPHLGWFSEDYGPVRCWWMHRREHLTGNYNSEHWRRHRDEFTDADDEVGESAPQQPDPAPQEPSASRRWVQAARVGALWCAGALLLVLAVRPAPWVLGVLLGGAGAGLVLVRRAARTDAERLAYQLSREQRVRSAQAMRADRQRRNRTAHAEAQAERDEAAREARALRREENRRAHWRPPYAD